ncbi:hypothetical protein C8R46DRAFT_1040617 [Mycena filopes]|nr:hypothetical protein C8R46DRAFT_1040617 [Mycena filopes]
MLKNHSNKGPCLATQAAKKPGKKPLKNSQISDWLRPKAPSVPSTVAAPPLIHPATIPSYQTLAPLASAPAPPSTPMSNLPRSLLEQLQAAIDILPVTVPEATEDDALAAFGRDPSKKREGKRPALVLSEAHNSRLSMRSICIGENVVHFTDVDQPHPVGADESDEEEDRDNSPLRGANRFGGIEPDEQHESLNCATGKGRSGEDNGGRVSVGAWEDVPGWDVVRSWSYGAQIRQIRDGRIRRISLARPLSRGDVAKERRA